MLAETTGTDNIRYLHGLDLVAQSDGVSTEYFAYDGLGSVRQVLDAAGLPLLTQTFDPYGNPYRYAGPTESVTSFGYSGEQTDSNGLVFLRARYYDPAQGRFGQMDPSRQEDNPYRYSTSNPINYIDPTGLWSFGPGDNKYERAVAEWYVKEQTGTEDGGSTMHFEFNVAKHANPYSIKFIRAKLQEGGRSGSDIWSPVDLLIINL